MVHGKGLSGTIAPGGSKVDENQQTALAGEVRRMSRTAVTRQPKYDSGQWAATVERMVKLRSALSPQMNRPK